jgi:hypothetical protein
MHSKRLRRIAATAALVLIGSSAGSAQDRPSEFDNWVLPGWSFTPGVSVSTMWDSNVALAGRAAETGRTEGDNVFVIVPFGMLAMNSTRTQFTTGYRGYVRRYQDIDQLNGFDQRAYASLRHMVTPRVTFFASNEFSEMPTTDLTELNGVPFARIGTRSNRLGTGFEFRVSKYTDVRLEYENTWTKFDRLDNLLSGGTIHGFRGTYRRRLSERLAVGAEGRLKRSDITRIDPRVIWFQDAGGTIEYRLTEHVATFFAAGLSHLKDSRFADTRNSPYFRASLTRETPRATAGVAFEKSFTPSYAFSGSNNNRELRAFVRMPFSRNRLYVQGDGLWRRSVPFFAGELRLDTFLTNVTVGYSAVRWLRLEGYHSFSRQDSLVTGGEVDRHRVGAQIVISQPMRIR